MRYMAYECINCGHEVVVTKGKSRYMDGRACEKCFGGPFNVYPTDRPPAPPKQHGHEHSFVHLETRYIYKSRVFRNPSYERIERFYCTKCCEEKVVEKYECSCRTPKWFDKKNYETVYE